uniref:chondrolectin-like isoform X4 n=1 Tax=Myxine glutinosa TaxID=7769 RepID=UPI00358E49FB
MQEMARCVILAVWTWTSVLSLMNASAAGSEVWTQGTEKPLLSGQTVCLHGTQRPCYKMAAFPYASRRLPFMAARRACETEGATLVSVDSPAEQRLLESLLSSLRVPPGGDGDFWIGLRRDSREGSTCAQRYSWIDGSKSKYRHWYTDEPSCGAEACVVMYHQPTARPGFGGRYLYRWNDDRCNMRHNYICKYAGEKMSETANSSVLEDYTSIPSILPFPDDSIISKESFDVRPSPRQSHLARPACGLHRGRDQAWTSTVLYQSRTEQGAATVSGGSPPCHPFEAVPLWWDQRRARVQVVRVALSRWGVQAQR